MQTLVCRISFLPLRHLADMLNILSGGHFDIVTLAKKVLFEQRLCAANGIEVRKVGLIPAAGIDVEMLWTSSAQSRKIC